MIERRDDPEDIICPSTMPRLVERTCLTCSARFVTTKYKVNEGRGNYCSRPCFYVGSQRVSDRADATVYHSARFDAAAYVTTKKYRVLVSVADLDQFLDHPGGWFCGTANGSHRYIQSNRLKIRLHTILMNRPNGKTVDHINGDTMDNRRENLRVVSSAQNSKNMRSRLGSTSQFVGVYWCKTIYKWAAQVKDIDGTTLHLGTYIEEQDAALIRDAASYHLHGDMAHLNFPDIVITSSFFTERVQRRIERARLGRGTRKAAA
jgi:hypothetical protein